MKYKYARQHSKRDLDLNFVIEAAKFDKFVVSATWNGVTYTREVYEHRISKAQESIEQEIRSSLAKAA
jgi:hypothetical protein